MIARTVAACVVHGSSTSQFETPTSEHVSTSGNNERSQQ
jgi:hypothetical protein